MEREVLSVFGGIGLFLLGMVVLTEGLKGLAGNKLRQVLADFTKTPLRGAAAGAAATAIVQSSSATTVTAVGFVGAGLLTFPQGLGIIFGANIGTTITGWIVALLGFRLELGVIVLPLVFVGVLLRMFGRGPMRHVGWALAGFSLLFLGIDTMQAGMAQFEGVVTPEGFPSDSLWARFELLLIGILITLITQSSSAGVATALVALSAGAITLPQAAAMVIGMDVGTTFTAALATVGGSAASRQTGLAHVIYNVMTGIMAFVLLGPFAAAADYWQTAATADGARMSLVMFHSGFNILGVLVVLPFTGAFARLIQRLVPERGLPLIRRLDERLLRDPAAAVDSAAATVHDIAFELFRLVATMLTPGHRPKDVSDGLNDVREALSVTRQFTARITTASGDPLNHPRHVSLLHAQDHLSRLIERCGQTQRIRRLSGDDELRQAAETIRLAILNELQDGTLGDSVEGFDELRKTLRHQREGFRAKTVETVAQGTPDGRAVLEAMDSIRWLHRVSYHLWRITLHLQRARQVVPQKLDTEEAMAEVAAD